MNIYDWFPFIQILLFNLTDTFGIVTQISPPCLVFGQLQYM